MVASGAKNISHFPSTYQTGSSCTEFWHILQFPLLLYGLVSSPHFVRSFWCFFFSCGYHLLGRWVSAGRDLQSIRALALLTDDAERGLTYIIYSCCCVQALGIKDMRCGSACMQSIVYTPSVAAVFALRYCLRTATAGVSLERCEYTWADRQHGLADTLDGRWSARIRWDELYAVIEDCIYS